MGSAFVAMRRSETGRDEYMKRFKSGWQIQGIEHVMILDVDIENTKYTVGRITHELTDVRSSLKIIQFKSSIRLWLMTRH